MVKQMKAAQKAARKAIEATYFGTLTVTERKKEKDERSKLTKDKSKNPSFSVSLDLIWKKP